MIVLDAAGGDPLRAQEIENGVSERWWSYALIYREQQTQAHKEMERERAPGKT